MDTCSSDVVYHALALEGISSNYESKANRHGYMDLFVNLTPFSVGSS